MSVRVVIVALALCVAWPSVGRAAPPVEKSGRISAVLPRKPTGPIATHYRLSAPPEVGVPLEVVVTARIEAGVTSVGIEATATAQRSVLVSVPVLERSEEGVYEWTIAIVPLTAEAGYLSVLVSGSLEGIPQAHAFMIPLRSPGVSGGPQPAWAGEGESFISLPVQETP